MCSFSPGTSLAHARKRGRGAEPMGQRKSRARTEVLLFSYGSNGRAQLALRLGHPVSPGAAYATGWRRRFVGWSVHWGGAVATLEPEHGATTYGSVCEVSPGDLERLDGFEGVSQGKYRRDSIAVQCLAGGVVTSARAVVYLATSTKRGAPARAYLEALAQHVGAHWRGVRWQDFEPR
jgi:hypothetical protein